MTSATRLEGACITREQFLLREMRIACQLHLEGLSDEEVALEGLKCMEKWMNEIGVVMHLSELGVTEDMIDGIADGTFLLEGGYKPLTRDEVVEILRESM